MSPVSPKFLARAGIEVLIVALGVLLALGVASWRDIGATAGVEGEDPADHGPAAINEQEGSTMRRVTGLGGLFFRSQDPKGTLDWYREHLGIESESWGGFAFHWREEEDPAETGYTVWGVFPANTKYFAPSEAPFMMNFRVADLGGLLVALKSEGVEVVGETQQDENGKFAWILDPEGRKVELWEPVPSKDDPNLREER